MIKKIHHVGIVVRTLDGAFPFYRDTLGLHVAKQDTIVDQGVKAALLTIGHSEIELLEPIQEGTSIARFLETRGEGMHHLCFETDDVDREIEGLKAKEVQLIDEAARPGLAGRICFIHPRGTHRTLVELAEPPGPAEAHPASGEVGARDLDFVSLGVADADAAARDYARLFGLSGEPFDLQDAGGRGVMLAVGPAFVELLAATNPDGPVGKLIAEAGEGMLAVTMRVEDVDRAVKYLREQGAQVRDVTPGPLPDTRSAWIEPASAHGVRLRLMQR